MGRRRKSALMATAYHEAGHAVIGNQLHIPLGKRGVTVIAKEGSYGSAHFPLKLPGKLGYTDTDGMRLAIERHTLCFLAGLEAQRKYAPRSVRNYHAHSDYHSAVELVSDVIHDPDEQKHYFRFLGLRVRHMLELPHVWVQVVAVADALAKAGTLSAKEVRSIMRDAVQSATERFRSAH